MTCGHHPPPRSVTIVGVAANPRVLLPIPIARPGSCAPTSKDDALTYSPLFFNPIYFGLGLRDVPYLQPHFSNKLATTNGNGARWSTF
jgi:hypothetical protein